MSRIAGLFFVLLLTAGVLLNSPVDAAEKKFVAIGTGGVTGVYYPAGSAICRLINRTRNEHGLRCVAESTGGSVANLRAIASGELDMGIAQTDWQHHAYFGTGLFEKQGPNKNLRTVFSLHLEPFTVVARADSGITNFSDLKGKRVNIGNPGSGQRATMEVVMAALGWEMQDFSLVAELSSVEQSKALCENKFDAMIFTVGHPSSSIREATSACRVALVNVDGPLIDKLVANNDYYQAATIPAGMYRGTDVDIKTFGVGATLVTSAQVADELVYQVVKVVFEHFDEFRRQQAVFFSLNKAQMINGRFSELLHPGARKYYQEVGLL